MRFASSLYAIGQTLRRRRERVEMSRRALATPEDSSEMEQEDQLFGDEEGDESATGLLKISPGSPANSTSLSMVSQTSVPYRRRCSSCS